MDWRNHENWKVMIKFEKLDKLKNIEVLYRKIKDV